MDNTSFTAECDTCGDRSDSEPGLPCGRPVHPDGDDHPDALPCTGTYQPSPPAPAPTSTDPASWRELFAMMTPVMWVRFALLAGLVVVWVVSVGVAIVRGVTGH